MKFIWLGLPILLLAFQSIGGSIPTFIIRKCVHQAQVAVLDLALFFGTDFTVVSKPVKCYFNCLFETSGFLIDGKVNQEMAEAISDPVEAKNIQTIIEVCDTMDTTEVCEAGYQFFKCVIAYKNKQGKSE